MKNRFWLSTYLLAAWTVQAAVLVDHFDGDDVGPVPSPWVITAGTPTVAEEAGGNRYQQSYGSYRTLGNLSIPGSDTETTVFYRIYKPAGTSPDCSVGLSHLAEPTGDWTNFEAYVVVYDGNLQARNNNGNTTILSPMGEATWHNIWLVLNNYANTYDVYVTTGQQDAAGTTPLANNFGFRNDAGDLLTFKIYGRPKNGPLWVDDIYISGGTDLTIPTQNTLVPVIVSSPSDLAIHETQQASFVTVFTSQTTPTVEWYKVDASSDLYMDPAQSEIDVQTMQDAGSEQYTTTLTLTAVAVADSGAYYCRVNNESGFARSSETADLRVYGLMSYWTLDHDSYVGGEYLEEVAGRNAAVNGTPVFVTGADGAANGAAQISAANGWALCPTFDPVQQSGQMTVSFWANWSETQVTQQNLIAESANETLTATGGLKADGQWQHICTVFDGAAGKLYVDGVLQDQTAWQVPAASDANINIGCSSDGENAFNGALDDMRVYNYALTEAQVAAVYDEIAGGCTPGFDGSYDFTGPEDTPDCMVDILDLAELANYFLTGDTAHDLTGPAGTPDGTVNLYELAELAAAWLTGNVSTDN